MSSSKKTLRKDLREQRMVVSIEDRTRAAEAIQKYFLSIIRTQPQTIVAGYWPVRGELDVLPLLGALRKQGCHIALPCVDKENAPLVFRIWDEDVPLCEGAYDVMTPDPEKSKAVKPDIVLLPLLGFDVQGNRLGYGAGFYDRTLARLNDTHDYLSVGVAFDMQKLDEVPVDDYDEPLNIIVTEKQVYFCERQE